MELLHARIRIKLHALQPGEGTPLLLLHALGEHGRAWLPAELGWSGPVHGLDLAGHGVSGRLHGGAYSPELWAADADIALAELGSAVLLGAGVGAYAALLLAGARPEAVRAVVMMGGAGLDGSGPLPDFAASFDSTLESTRTTAPARELLETPQLDRATAFSELGVRPPDYSDGFARAAQRVLLIEDDSPRPPWWQSLREVEGVVRHRGPVAEALARL
ncbi:MAG: hypothetical protein OXT09_13020 [Myxococcales bacterium]|nr:hypothetical protein [Myxococcales bacterium]